METPNRTTPTPTSTTKLQQTVHKCDVAAAHLGNDVIILGCTIILPLPIPTAHFRTHPYKAVCLHLRLHYGVDVIMVANEVNKFGQIFPRYLFIGVGYRVISLLLISPPKVIYAE
jgi:hypothetical protein